jgi:hypothetical protein
LLNNNFFINVNKNEYLICSAVCKMCNVEQNFMTMNKNCLGKYLNDRKIQNEADDLKCNFWSYEAIFSKSANRAKVATIASCTIAESFPKWRKCLKVVVTLKKFSCGHWSVTNEFKNKTEYEMQLMRLSHYKCEMCVWWHWTQTKASSSNLYIFYPSAIWVNWYLWHFPITYYLILCSVAVTVLRRSC